MMMINGLTLYLVIDNAKVLRMIRVRIVAVTSMLGSPRAYVN